MESMIATNEQGMTWAALVLFTIFLVVAILLTVYLMYRYSKRQSDASQLATHNLVKAGWAIAVLEEGREQILHANGLKRLLESKQGFATINELSGILSSEEETAFKDFILAEIPEQGERSIMLRTKDNLVLEAILSEAEWQSKTAYLLVIRKISKAYRKMLAVQKENDALKLEALLHSNALNYIHQPVWVRGEDYTIRYCNLPYMLVIEENEDAMIGGAMPELFKGARRLAEMARLEKKPQRQKHRLIVNGERKLFEIVEIYHEALKGTVGYAQDITALERAEAEISDHLTTLEDLLDSSSSAMSIYGMDTRLKFYNQAYVRMWGLDEGWLSREPTFSEMLEHLRESRKLPEQVNFPAFKQQRLRLFNDVTEPHEELFYLPDGRTLRNVAIPHSAGGILFIYEDVTDRLALERSYNTLIAVQRETLDNLHEGVVVFGEDGRLRLKNPVFLSLWELDEKDLPDGTHISDMLEKTKSLYVAENWSLFKSDFIGQVQSRTIFNSRIERTDGAVIDASVVPLPDGGVLLTYVDVTATTLVERSLRERNEALEAGDKLKTEFLANMSYELRSPLTSISGFAEMLRQDYFGALTDKQREYVEGIHNSSQHLMHLINDILDLSSIEAGYMTLNVREFDVYRLLNAMMALLSERLREFELTASIECPETIGTMIADETRIRQVLFHLLSNAVKYSKEAGHIVLGAYAENNGIALWVKDNGIGISEADQRDVFDKFYRGSSGVRKPGTGLGLSMVKSFVELHGGKVMLESEPGNGTKVTCWIPRDTSYLAVRSTRQLEQQHNTNTAKAAAQEAKLQQTAAMQEVYDIEGSPTIH